jgi:hypothetical protein
MGLQEVRTASRGATRSARSLDMSPSEYAAAPTWHEIRAAPLPADANRTRGSFPQLSDQAEIRGVRPIDEGRLLAHLGAPIFCRKPWRITALDRVALFASLAK